MRFKINRYMNAATGEGDAGSAGAGQGGTVTTEDLDKKIGAAVSGMAKRLETKFAGLVEEKLTGALGAFGEKFEELKALTSAPREADGATGGAGQGKPNPEIEKLQKQIETLKEANARAERAREDEKKAREQREAEIAAGQERDALAKLLDDGGVKDARRAGAVAYLYLDQKRVKRNEKGEVCFADKDEFGDEVLMPLAAGVKKWLGSDEGKAYLPPVPASGTGTRGGNPGRTGAGFNRAQAEHDLFSGGLDGIAAALTGGEV